MLPVCTHVTFYKLVYLKATLMQMSEEVQGGKINPVATIRSQHSFLNQLVAHLVKIVDSEPNVMGSTALFCLHNVLPPPPFPISVTGQRSSTEQLPLEVEASSTSCLWACFNWKAVGQQRGTQPLSLVNGGTAVLLLPYQLSFNSSSTRELRLEQYSCVGDLPHPHPPEGMLLSSRCILHTEEKKRGYREMLNLILSHILLIFLSQSRLWPIRKHNSLQVLLPSVKFVLTGLLSLDFFKEPK